MGKYHQNHHFPKKPLRSALAEANPVQFTNGELMTDRPVDARRRRIPGTCSWNDGNKMKSGTVNCSSSSTSINRQSNVCREKRCDYRHRMGHRHPLLSPCLLLSLVLFQTCAAISDNDPEPKFATSLKNLTVTAGREAKLSCLVENLAEYKIAWTH
ncbi:uncharacterized protein [Palaemon carinicauda]|uniref:uncharacterized protein n=1 Tax=Palaemon carinicauda TaxID=392227 RepID=UPI0035B5D560